MGKTKTNFVIEATFKNQARESRKKIKQNKREKGLGLLPKECMH